eukprot:6199524-Pleurochrysis_carterae.AAC.3
MPRERNAKRPSCLDALAQVLIGALQMSQLQGAMCGTATAGGECPRGYFRVASSMYLSYDRASLASLENGRVCEM